MAQAVYQFDRRLLASCATSRAHYPEGTVVMGYEVALEGIFISGRRAVGSTRHLATIVHDTAPAAGDNPETDDGRMPYGHASLWITRKVLRKLRRAAGPAAVRIELGDESVDWFFGDKKITVTHVLKYDSGHPDYPDSHSLVSRVLEDRPWRAEPVATLTIASDVLKVALNVADAIDPNSDELSLRVCQSPMNYHVIRYCSADGCAMNNIFSIVSASSGADLLPAFALADSDSDPRAIWRSDDIGHMDDDDYNDDAIEEDSDDVESGYDPDDDEVDLDDIE